MRQPVPFGKYLLLDRISVGGMAEVFKAKSYGVEGFEKIIAIKRILPTMGEDRDFIKMFIDEAKIAGQLAHANICQIFELGRIDGSHFIAMEYIWGKDLLQIQNRLRKIKGQMPIPMACFAIAKVLEGLDYAHRKRDAHGRPLEIVHRDCSPQNVLVSYEGEVKVIDFGIAKATSRNSRTMAGVLKGKFGYMSPEQVRGLPLDRRSDIFAIGTMLYECLTGDRLFQGETDFSTLEKVRNVDIQAPRAINPAIPESVERVILKALAKDVDDRYQWCSEMLADLQAYLMGQDVVFTAKTLSSWLKDIFAQEIDRERQQLEQYKRVGRDGLIGGLPSAEADRDVVSGLGEAGAPEGDATTLGGPSFDDIEQAAGATPNVGPVGPAPGSPAMRGLGSVPELREQRAETNEDSNDFGEEAPTEIFGDSLDQKLPPPAMPPPRPPARAPTMQRPAELAAVSIMRNSGSTSTPMPAQGQPQSQPPPMQYGQASPQGGVPQQYPANPAYGYPPPPMGSDPAVGANGTPGAFAVGHSGPQHPGSSKTVLGLQPPSPQNGQYGYPPPQQQPSSGPYAYPQYQQPARPYPSGQYGVPGSQPYGAMQGPPPGYAVDGMQNPGEAKKSTLVRDVAIGVAIAAVVLGGFFIAKFVVLDRGDDAPPPTTSTIATIKLAITPGIAADLFVDDKKIATVMDKQEIPVSAGNRHVALVGPSGTKCDEQVTLEAGKTTTLKCEMAAPPPVPAGSAAGSAAPTAGSAAAGSASGSGAGSATVPAAAGSAAPKPAAAATVTVPPTPTIDATVQRTPAKTTNNTTTPATKSLATPSPPKPDTSTKSDTSKSADVSGKGYLTITSKPNAKIAIDGVDVGMSTPISGHALPLAPGKHKVTFVMGDDRYTFPVTITAGQTQAMTKDLE